MYPEPPWPPRRRVGLYRQCSHLLALLGVEQQVAAVEDDLVQLLLPGREGADVALVQQLQEGAHALLEGHDGALERGARLRLLGRLGARVDLQPAPPRPGRRRRPGRPARPGRTCRGRRAGRCGNTISVL